MSLAHGVFSLSAEEQDEAIRTLARKSPSMRRFLGRYVRPLQHALHAAGSTTTKEAINHWKNLYREVQSEKRAA